MSVRGQLCFFPHSVDEGGREGEVGGTHTSKNECDHCGRCGEHQEVGVEMEGWERRGWLGG